MNLYNTPENIAIIEDEDDEQFEEQLPPNIAEIVGQWDKDYEQELNYLKQQPNQKRK